MTDHDLSHRPDQPPLAFVLGTRPEIIKLAPLLYACQASNQPFVIIHTNQHYSPALDAIFFAELRLPKPTHQLAIGPASPMNQIGRMLAGLEKIFVQERPHAVLVQGDTNSVLAGALAAAQLGIPVGHVEAGLRSYDRQMPEEINRVLVDHLATWLFAPTPEAATILRHEGINETQIFLVGNTIVEAIARHRPLAKSQSTIMERLGLQPKTYFLLTLHRPANVDSRPVLEAILGGLGQLYQRDRRPIIFPIHPRTENQLGQFGLTVPAGIRVIKPGGYLDFLRLEEEAELILTDSGGVQEEACILGVPCVTLRDNTKRPETVTVGANMVAGRTAAAILQASRVMLARSGKRWTNPFGDGTTSQKILAALTLSAGPSATAFEAVS